ncbi:SDR family NAD(P)-dependent oxidoreductase [Campylobacter sp. FMV-PI01]|uniref:SDR family NAD(P)-dependent oxidoreductase n=1 Tax=Campylobacter portucalensis TaxID=2608384 RepID=A0A6L5WIS4_9BACT|nr:SDR family NAD(P)-dependent oxidoreductase [Campylobacter portucalensis]MSN97049.1 SDR family NAD(P)-dependent oxidoreductase [Campylobacter portucalensis]
MSKTIFITGATSGFGEAIARKFGQNGYNLIILGRRKDRLQNLTNEFKDIKIHQICADVRDKEAIFDAIENLPDEFKNIDILVNNAGLALGQDKFMQANLDDFEVMIDTNIKGVIYVTKATLPYIKKGGFIANIGSVAGNWSYEGSSVYGSSKAFIRQFSLNLRNDLKGTGIRVTNIEPGLCKTEFSIIRFKGDIKKANSIYENTQFIKASDIARIVFEISQLPQNLNINTIEVMATTQSWAGFYNEKLD